MNKKQGQHTLKGSSQKIGRQQNFFSNMKRTQPAFFAYLQSLDGRHIWQRYQEYMIRFDELVEKGKDMHDALTYNRQGKEFVAFMGKHDSSVANMHKYSNVNYSWRVFERLNCIDEQYTRFREAQR